MSDMSDAHIFSANIQVIVSSPVLAAEYGFP